MMTRDQESVYACVCVEWPGERIRWRGECVELRAGVVSSSSEQQVERLYMILSFRPSAGSWLGVLAYRRPCNHASPCGFFISHGVSLWAMKLAVLLRLHHSRHSRQLASCVKDLGRKIFRAGLRYAQNRV